MWPYILMFLMPAYLAWDNTRLFTVSTRWSDHWRWAFVLLVLLIGLRHEVGGDWGNYLRHIEEAESTSLTEALAASEIAYSILNWIAAQSGLGVYLVNTVCAVLFAWGLVVFCRNLALPWLAMVVAIPYLLIVVAMGYSRQGVAIGLAMLALVALDKDRVITFVLWLALAAMFHKSAVILVPLAIFHRTKRPWLEWTIVAASSITLYYLMLQNSVESLHQGYIVAEYQSSGAAIRVAMNALPAAIFFWLRKRFVLTSVQSTFWTWMSIGGFAFVVLLIISPSSTAVDRVALYWIPLQLFVWSQLPIALGQQSRASKRWIQYIILYSATVQIVWLFFADNACSWLPYKFYPLVWLTNS